MSATRTKRSAKVRAALAVAKHIEKTMREMDDDIHCAPIVLKDPTRLDEALAELQLDADLLLLQAVSDPAPNVGPLPQARAKGPGAARSRGCRS
jgi:hypothetical protein